MGRPFVKDFLRKSLYAVLLNRTQNAVNIKPALNSLYRRNIDFFHPCQMLDMPAGFFADQYLVRAGKTFQAGSKVYGRTENRIFFFPR